MTATTQAPVVPDELAAEQPRASVLARRVLRAGAR